MPTVAPDPVAVIKYLEVEIKKTKANGKIAADDISVLEYQSARRQLLEKAMTGTNIYLVPDVPLP